MCVYVCVCISVIGTCMWCRSPVALTRVHLLLCNNKAPDGDAGFHNLGGWRLVSVMTLVGSLLGRRCEI